MKKFIYGTFIVLVTLGFSGCGIKTSEYSVSADNVSQLRDMEDTKISVGEFTANKPGEKQVMCRLAETITTPGGESFEKYIEDALTSELKMAGIYDKNSDLQIRGRLLEIYGSSMLGNAFWEVEVTINSSNGKHLTVKTKREYPSSFLAYTACNNMATSFSPTIRKLIQDIINHKDFNSLLKS